MNKVILVQVVIALILANLFDVNALKCQSNVGLTDDKYQSVECLSGSVACFKSIATTSGKDLVTRGCSASVCNTATCDLVSSKVTTYYCKGDNCNDSTSLNKSRAGFMILCSFGIIFSAIFASKF